MISSTDIFIANMKTVLNENGWSNRDLGKNSGVSDRMIGMYLNGDSSPSLDNAEKIANALGYQLWQMQMPDFHPDVIAAGGFAKLYHAYFDSDKDGRQVIESTADYVTRKNDSPSNDPDPGGNDKKESAG